MHAKAANEETEGWTDGSASIGSEEKKVKEKKEDNEGTRGQQKGRENVSRLEKKGQ